VGRLATFYFLDIPERLRNVHGDRATSPLAPAEESNAGDLVWSAAA
jgi:hypothetical protein